MLYKPLSLLLFLARCIFLNKKGSFAIIGGVLVFLIAMIIIVSVAIPTVKTSTDVTSTTQSLIQNVEPNELNTTLTYSDLETGSLSIAGLTLTNNYTIDYTTGVVTFVAGSSINGTYTASYNYYADSYLDSTSNRMAFGLVSLVLIFGLVYWIGKLFGMF